MRRRMARDKMDMQAVVRRSVQTVLETILDFALPPRCAGCGEIVDADGALCGPCWNSVEWLGSGGCQMCGLPLEGTEAEMCGRCLADPPKLDRIRAAVAYGDVARGIALRLKYGRRVALAKTMARYMAPLRGDYGGDAVLVPVPLHRWRLWTRGFNQSALVADALGKRWNIPVAKRLLRRLKKTPPLKGLNHRQRRKTVSGAFRCDSRIEGSTVILVDDVYTSGSTAEACARALRKAGAARVELICWARVLRPAIIDTAN